MKPIRFTRHAQEKLALIQRQGFGIDEETVVGAIRTAQRFSFGYSGRLIAQAILDEEHVLRVVYEEGEETTVVTLYPEGVRDMKVKYSRDVDILLVWVSDDPFDYAEESNGVITHFSSDGKPVLLEIQGAKDFLLSSLTSLIEDKEVRLPGNG